jgi:hypothetical protein
MLASGSGADTLGKAVNGCHKPFEGESMKIRTLTVTMILAAVGAAHGTDNPNDNDKKAQEIIAKKCTGCHGEAKIKAAFSSGRDMRAVQKEMQRRAGLSAKEQEVLGIFWKKKQPVK